MRYLTTSLWILLLALLFINIFATYKVACSYMYERRQKIAQIVAIWIIPIIGGVLAIHLANPKHQKNPAVPLTNFDGHDNLYSNPDIHSSD